MLGTIAVIVIVLAIAIAALIGFAATRPDTFVVQRTATIKAPPSKIFPLINDFHQWGQWSPWENKDPTMKRSFSGAASGTGAVYAWDGNRNIGTGRMEITDASPPSRITIKLDFIKPFEGHNVAEFSFVPSGDATTVTWAMHGPLHLLAKVMHLFLNMDRMIGKEFETGLTQLKAVSEQ